MRGIWVAAVVGIGASAWSAQAQTLEARVDLGVPTPMPLVAEEIFLEIDHQHVTTQLTQTFANELGAQVEGRYVLRTGEGARVRGFAYWNGDEKIVGEVLERQTAQRVYRSVTAERRDPGIIEQVGEGLFTFRVFPIQTGERKRIEITWAQWLRRHGARVEYRVPLGRPDARVRISFADSRRIGDLVSPTHQLAVNELGDGQMSVEVLSARGAPGELILSWEVVERPWDVTALVHRDRGHDAYVALMLAAPERLPGDAIAAKDVTIVIDHSGSMAGEPLQRAKLAAMDVVQRLGEDDRCNIIQFDDSTDHLFAEPREMTRATRAEIIDYIDAVRDGGGTNIAGALERALQLQNVPSAERPRVVVFITDGRSDPSAALQIAERAAGDVRVFTVGIGEGVQRPLLSRIASLRRGRFTFIENASAIESSIGHLYRQIEAPVLVGLSLETEGGSLQRVYPRSLPDLFRNDELRVVARVRGSGRMVVKIRGTYRGETVEHAVRVNVPEQTRRPWVGRVWAEERVDDLLEEIALHGENAELVDEVTELALAYRFVTPYTAFLAIPASELTAEGASLMDGARRRSARILAANPDAAALMSGATGANERLAVQAGAAPPDMGGGSADEEADQPSYSLAPSAERAGCQSCTIGTDRAPPLGSALALLSLVALVAIRTRRRRRVCTSRHRGPAPATG